MLFGGIAESIFSGLLNMITSFMSVCMTPINLLIQNSMPNVQAALNTMNSYLNLIGSYLGFVLSYLGFYPELIYTALDIIIALMFLPFIAHSIKLVIRWYRVLMP